MLFFGGRGISKEGLTYLRPITQEQQQECAHVDQNQIDEILYHVTLYIPIIVHDFK